MRTKIFIAILALGSLLLVGCDAQVSQNQKDAQAQTLLEGHEEELAEAIDKASDQAAEEVAEQEPVVVEEAVSDASESPEVTLAKCLTASGAHLYTASWCGHCANQKAAFGDGLEYLNNTDCAAFGGWAEECTDAGVSAVPTWIFADGTTQQGNTPLEKLAELGGCTYETN